MKDHSLKAVIMVSSLNFALKSEQEKDATVAAYQSFLNSLNFPIQILCQSRNLDLKNYLEGVKNSGYAQGNPLLKLQVDEYINYVNTLLESASVMEKRFFVVVPYYPGVANEVPGIDMLIGKKQETIISTSFENNKNALLERVESVIQGLASVGLRCASLGTEDLLELFYTIYNPDVAENQKIPRPEEIDVPIIKSEQNIGE